jgi:hypothetical protein
MWLWRFWLMVMLFTVLAIVLIFLGLLWDKVWADGINRGFNDGISGGFAQGLGGKGPRPNPPPAGGCAGNTLDFSDSACLIWAGH